MRSFVPDAALGPSASAPRRVDARTASDAASRALGFSACCVSPRGRFVYAAADDGALWAFDARTGARDAVRARVGDGVRDVAGIAHHPQRNLLATWAPDGTLKLWGAPP